MITIQEAITKKEKKQFVQLGRDQQPAGQKNAIWLV